MSSVTVEELYQVTENNLDDVIVILAWDKRQLISNRVPMLQGV